MVVCTATSVTTVIAIAVATCAWRQQWLLVDVSWLAVVPHAAGLAALTRKSCADKRLPMETQTHITQSARTSVSIVLARLVVRRGMEEAQSLPNLPP